MKTKSMTLKLVMLVIMISVTLFACGGGSVSTVEPAKPQLATQEQAQPQPTQAVPASKPQVAVLIFTQEPDTMNPLYTNMYYSTILHPLWNVETWQFDNKNAAYPVLVIELPTSENGGISTDGKVITLHLRNDIKWSDGQPLTSTDFKFTYEMTMAKKNTVATTYPYDSIASIDTPDAQTVVINFKEPFAPWLLLFKSLLPEHVLKPVFDKEGTLDNAEWNKKPTVGIGPYVFKEWQSGSQLLFVRNDNYFGEKARLDQIFIRIVPDDASQVAALKAGDGDLGIFIAYPDVPPLEQAGVKIVSVSSGFSEGWFFNLGPKGSPALQDVRVRQALGYAVDRGKISKDLLLGKTKPGASLWDNTMYVDPSLTPLPYDPEKAKQLLDEAGWQVGAGGIREKDGVKLALRYGTTTKEVRQSTQAVVQQMLEQVGIKIDLFNYDSDIFFADYTNKGPAYTGELDIMEWSDAPLFPDPDISYWRCDQIPSDESPQGTNAEFLCDKELDGLFKLQATQVDLKQRIDTFHKISKLMYDKVYWLSIWQDPDIWAIGKRLDNVKLSGITPFYNVAEWTVK
jgi:peptide/nickel transport system substrate-binding protein